MTVLAIGSMKQTGTVAEAHTAPGPGPGCSYDDDIRAIIEKHFQRGGWPGRDRL
ncbi:hypothetical protein AHiyo6_07440 [Arthrobacter sp. Hiyo6]|nr:hypothetical protein AHiyo6_07440 [Arthrobacter sp. Hiyo6]